MNKIRVPSVCRDFSQQNSQFGDFPGRSRAKIEELIKKRENERQKRLFLQKRAKITRFYTII